MHHPDACSLIGGGGTWLGGSYDARTDTLIFGAGNPDGTEGDNLYAASRIGIDPATGEIRWHFQTTPREGLDYDGGHEVVAYDDRDGNQRLATADRSGFFYVLGAADGSFVSGTPCVKDISWASGLEKNRPGNPAAAADGVLPAQRQLLRPLRRVGHGHLERADHLQKGCGLRCRR